MSKVLSKIRGRVRKHIIERKQMEDLILEKEEKLCSVFDSSNDAIISIDENGKVVFWNKAAETIFGYKAEEMINKPVTLIMPQIYRASHEKGLRNFVATGSGKIVGETLELAGLAKNGSEIPIELSLSSWKSKSKHFFTGIIRDITERKHSDLAIQHSVETLKKNLNSMIQAMSLAVEAKDSYTAGHQRRVSELSKAIALEMELPKNTIDGIALAATIHDLGKISIPAETLSKPGKLNDMEYELVKMHVKAGFDILKTIDFPWPIAQILLQHHEKLDGSGYPLGLKNNEILLEAKIICVADVVEAISSHRPYRPALTIETA
ncbi:sensory box protein, partial [Candidatus Magnetoovum chiemensis]